MAVALVASAAPFIVPHHARAQTPAPREVGLADIEAYAREHAPELRVARARQQLGAGARAAASVLLSDNPDLELAVGPRWNRGGRNSDYDFSAGVSQPIEISGARGARQRAAARFDERLTAEADATAFDVQVELAFAYRSAQLAVAQLTTARRSVAFATETRAIVERRLSAGEATIIELRVAEGDLARSQRDLNLAEQAARSARLQLCEQSGWPASNPPLPAASLPPLRAAPVLEAVLDLAAKRHPELRVRRAALEQARAEADLADRAAWPAPAIGVQLEREGGIASATEWIALGTVRIPLPFWQRNQVERERAKAEQIISRAELEASGLSLGVRIRRAASELEAATERVKLLTASSVAFEDSLALLRKGLEAGELALLDVSVARERFLAAEVAALSARADYELAWLELERAAGQPLGGDL